MGQKVIKKQLFSKNAIFVPYLSFVNIRVSEDTQYCLEQGVKIEPTTLNINFGCYWDLRSRGTCIPKYHVHSFAFQRNFGVQILLLRPGPSLWCLEEYVRSKSRSFSVMIMNVSKQFYMIALIKSVKSALLLICNMDDPVDTYSYVNMSKISGKVIYFITYKTKEICVFNCFCQNIYTKIYPTKICILHPDKNPTGTPRIEDNFGTSWPWDHITLDS